MDISATDIQEETLMETYCALIRETGCYVERCLSGGILITSYDTGLADLHDYSLKLECTWRNVTRPIVPGDSLRLGRQLYAITAIGNTARDSLFRTGVLVMLFDHGLHPLHEGAMHLDGPPPHLSDLTGTFVIEEGYPWR
ncbi:TPA: PTS glucitol/sorbitol transporter subunit IIA [Klebsiella aerogenes]